MPDRGRAKLTYANVMSTIAVFLALGGAAIAGTDALTGKVTKAKVKKIAAQQIANAAPTLSVAHAAAADTATNAAHADSATNADHATNADAAASAATAGLLDGYDSNGLIRVAGNSTANAPDANGPATSTTIEAPGNGWLVIFATADFAYPGAGTDQIACLLQIDDVNVPGTSRSTNVSGAAGVDSDCATNATRAVAAGSHKVDLEITDRDTAAVEGAGVSVLFTPFNATGVGGFN